MRRDERVERLVEEVVLVTANDRCFMCIHTLHRRNKTIEKEYFNYKMKPLDYKWIKGHDLGLQVSNNLRSPYNLGLVLYQKYNIKGVSNMKVFHRVLVHNNRLFWRIIQHTVLEPLDMYFNGRDENFYFYRSAIIFRGSELFSSADIIRRREKLRSAENYNGSVKKNFNPDLSNRNLMF